MIFLFFPVAMFSESPIFSVPGIFSSDIYATIINRTQFPQCKTFPTEKTKIWPLKEEYIECIDSLMDIIAYENGTISSKPGVLIETDPIHKSQKGSVPFLNDFNNVFEVPYNWNLYYPGIPDLFANLKNKIEIEVNLTSPNDPSQREKAFIAGYSLGGNFVRYFLTHYVTENWKQEYIQGAIFLVAGVGGAFSSPLFIVQGGIFTSQKMEFCKHMPGYFTMIPNYVAHGKMAEFDGKSIKASEIFDTFINISEQSQSGITFINKNEQVNITINIDETSKRVYNAILPYLQEDIKDPNVPTLIGYNSGIPVIGGANVTTIGPNLYEFVQIDTPGDGVMPSSGIEYAISHWKNVVWHDYNTSDSKYDHGGLKDREELREFIREFILDNAPTPTDQPGKKMMLMILVIVFSVAIVILIVAIVVIAILISKKKKKQAGDIFQSLNN